jgi:hypothetical protein
MTAVLPVNEISKLMTQFLVVARFAALRTSCIAARAKKTANPNIPVRGPQAVAIGGICENTAGQKKRLHKAGVKLLRQGSYRQETYRAVTPL